MMGRWVWPVVLCAVVACSSRAGLSPRNGASGGAGLNAASNIKPPNTDAVLNIAFAIPLASQNPSF